MTNYTGEYECTLDAKGRILLPTALLKQISETLRSKFVVNRHVFQKCLVLYPMDAWNDIVGDLSKLNRFKKENDDFIRQYTNGASAIELDAASRLLLPKRLLDFAKIEKDITLSAALNKVEIWSTKHYQEIMNKYDHESFSELAEKVMGKPGNNLSNDSLS